MLQITKTNLNRLAAWRIYWKEIQFFSPIIYVNDGKEES